MTAILIAAAGFVFIVAVAFVVGITDMLNARVWRQIAAERRENWEQRQLQHQVPHRNESWDD